jgi:hypothetical protein
LLAPVSRCPRQAAGIAEQHARGTATERAGKVYSIPQGNLFGG